MTRRSANLLRDARRGTRTAVVLQVVAVALTAWLVGSVTALAADPLTAMGVVTAEQGREAPDFALTDTDGKRWILREHRGRLVLVTFFTTW